MLTQVKTMHIYMKSGNVIEIDKVKDIEIDIVGNEITRFNIDRSTKAKNLLFVSSLNLSQIEAIVTVKVSYMLFY